MEATTGIKIPADNQAGTGHRQWFVMRDLSRSNAKLPAREMLREKNIRHFTPMVWLMATANGKRQPRLVPYIQDLIFVYDTREVIDPLVERIRTFQYRYLRNTWREPMTVPGRGNTGHAGQKNTNHWRATGRIHGDTGHRPGIQTQKAARGNTHAPGCSRGSGTGVYQTDITI